MSVKIYMFKCVYIPNLRQTELLCFPRVPVEDLLQFIARSRFESAGYIDAGSSNLVESYFYGQQAVSAFGC